MEVITTPAILAAQHQQHSGLQPPPQSPAITKMKAFAAYKDREALQYMKKFTTNPYTAESVRSKKVHNGEPTPAYLLSSGLNSAGSAMIRRPKSANARGAEKHAEKVWGSVAGSTRSSDGTSTQQHLRNQNSTALISSPIAINLMTSLRDSGISSAMAAAVGAAIEEGGAYAEGENDKIAALPRHPALPNHPPPQTVSNPTGAHASGFYSKNHYNRNIRSATTKTPDVNTLLRATSAPSGRRHKRAHTFDGVVKEEPSSAGSSKGFHLRSSEHAPKIAFHAEETAEEPLKTPAKKTFHVSDIALMDKHLSILTDPDCTINQISDSLSTLLSIIQENCE
jgi:hypothetical protein